MPRNRLGGIAGAFVALALGTALIGAAIAGLLARLWPSRFADRFNADMQDPWE